MKNIFYGKCIKKFNLLSNPWMWPNGLKTTTDTYNVGSIKSVRVKYKPDEKRPLKTKKLIHTFVI